MTLNYGSTDDQVGLFVRCCAADRDTVLEPIVANHPQARVTFVEEGSVAVEVSASQCEVWHSDVQLVSELFPILRHAQFEDALNHNFADPVSGLFRAILPEPEVNCRIEITIRPATRHRCHEATAKIEAPAFASHHSWILCRGSALRNGSSKVIESIADFRRICV